MRVSRKTKQLCWSVLAASCVTALTACGGGGSSGGELLVEKDTIPVTETQPYRPTAQYASVLSECALADPDAGNLCKLSKLPYIGISNPSVSVDDIMERVVVTHDWMGVRFEELLRRMPAEMIGLFATITTIVIGSDVRPSSFWHATGTMRLDPSYLWLTVEEKNTVSRDADFRSDYGSDLQFVSLTRDMIGDNYASGYYSLDDDVERTLFDIEISFVSVMYHELAHANDIVQRSKLSSLSMDLTPWQIVDQEFENSVSVSLYENEALTSENPLLYALAEVQYYDETPTEIQSSVSADAVGAAVGNEGKTNFYSYSSIFEDSANLLEAAMLSYHYGIETHTAFLDKPANYPASSCNEYIVAWGERNRLASPLVAPRAQFIVNAMISATPEIDNFFATGLGQATPLRVGDGWCDSASSNAQASSSDRVATRVQENPAWRVVKDYK